jgi:hypothetical protein
MEGQAREVKGEGEDDGGGGTRATKPNNDDNKIIALAPPAIKEIAINQDGGRLWSREEATGNGEQVREVRVEEEEGGRGDERNKAHLIDTTIGETRQWADNSPPLKITINWWWWASWTQCATEGLERRQWWREKTTRERRSMTKPIPSTKPVGRHDNDNKNEMIKY